MCQTVGLVQDSTLLQFLAGGTEILCLVLKKYWWSIARPNQIQSRFHFKYLCGWWKSFCLTFVPLSNWSLEPDCIWYPQAFSVAPRDKATTSPGQSCKPPGGANISFSWSRIHHEEWDWNLWESAPQWQSAQTSGPSTQTNFLQHLRHEISSDGTSDYTNNTNKSWLIMIYVSVRFQTTVMFL